MTRPPHMPTDPPQGDEEATRLAGLPSAAQASVPQPPVVQAPVPQGDDERTQFAFAPATEEATRFDTGAAAGAPAAKPSAGQADLKIGTLINNNYRVTAELKAGGMGSVYRGVEIGTGDPVAIKLVLSVLAEHEQTAMLFRREARTLRQLTHPAIVRYYNYVQDPQLDRYFLVMEYIDGIALSDYVVSRGTLGSEAALTLMERLAGGLGSAHALGVIHRDLSPDNVMLPGGDIAQARLIDFGIARSAIQSDRQLDNQFAGKLKYVAPEQLGLYGGDAGPRADIYGLALLVIAALQGKPLQMGATIEEAIERRAEVPDISAVPLRLQPLLRQMLAPDPADRPASMEALLAKIEALRAPAQPRPVAGLSLPPGLQGPLPPEAPVPERSGMDKASAPKRKRDPLPRRLVLLMGVVFAAVLGFAGWQSGWLRPQGQMEASGAGAVAEAANGLAPREAGTRDAFLASYPSAPACFYAHRLTAGPRTGVLSVLSTADAGTTLPAPDLVSDYAKTFGAAPGRFDARITDAQCPVLDFAREMQARPGPDLALTVANDDIASGETLRATLEADPQAQTWVGLVTPEGQIYNLGGRLTGKDLAFALSTGAAGQAQTQLVLSIASTQALVGLATLQDGAEAAKIMPGLLAEIRQTGQQVSVRVTPIHLHPAPDEAAE
ncbi:serine/threonine-protein kinase [Thioclava sp. GXIMD4216]|uniref:serine/threonine-protein kinase n=1 Tax=Thioclava sp. GXIMD4216 TaxID=3131929 RepID=UPI0030CE0EE5